MGTMSCPQLRCARRVSPRIDAWQRASPRRGPRTEQNGTDIFPVHLRTDTSMKSRLKQEWKTRVPSVAAAVVVPDNECCCAQGTLATPMDATCSQALHAYAHAMQLLCMAVRSANLNCVHYIATSPHGNVSGTSVCTCECRHSNMGLSERAAVGVSAVGV